ncbi:anthranilate synthase component II [Paenibacillus sp.]|uniref:anthranilate synthase component II n=1 Tax=Paenibacillus sp. TaxID=58172 RepID=UPI0028286859|nr:anthranilate/aminodeoxychorismate synthase component II [Paenibacillus sp.]
MSKNKILVIDNYDSFTYNLVHLLQELGESYEVVRNDKFELSYVDQFDYILLSPGPGIPEEAGLLMDVIRTYAASKRILGICLGQQAIAEVFGGTLYNMPKPLHGVASSIIVTDREEKLFQESDCTPTNQQHPDNPIPANKTRSHIAEISANIDLESRSAQPQ